LNGTPKLNSTGADRRGALQRSGGRGAVAQSLSPGGAPAGSNTSLPLLFCRAPSPAPIPSTSARRLAIHALARALEADPGALAITAPWSRAATEHGRPAAAALSLSHHGRFVGKACALQATAEPRAALRLAIINRGEAAMRCIRR
jgi:hypothetical protein